MYPPLFARPHLAAANARARKFGSGLVVLLAMLGGLGLGLGPAPHSAHAQDRREAQDGQVLTVQTCVDIALERNLQRQLQQLQVQASGIEQKQVRMSYLPSVNGNFSANRQFGTTFDAFSFTRTREETDFVSPRLQANLPIFEGLSRYYNLRRANKLLAADQAGVEVTENQIVQNVLSQYLQLVFDDAIIAQSEQRLALLEKQKERSERLFSAGAGVEADVLNLRGQVASERLSLVNAQNRREQTRMLLLQQLQLDPMQDYVFEIPDSTRVGADLDAQIPELPDLLADAYQTMPELREQQLRLQAAEDFARINRGNLWPSLSLVSSLGSNYSSNVRRFMPERAGLGNQLEDNFFQTLGVSLNVPILNGWQVQRNVQIAQNQTRVAAVNLQVVQDQLTRDVQQAWLDTRAAQTRYNAVNEQLAALREAFAYANKRYNAGALDFYSWLESLNNLNQTELERTQARFDLYFRRHLLRIFQGEIPSFE